MSKLKFHLFGQRLARAIIWSIAVTVFSCLMVGVAMARQDLKSLFADKPPPGTTPVEATWVQGNIFLPAGALRNGSSDHLNIFAKKDNWVETAKNKHLKDGVRLPAVIFLHGCTGFNAGRRLVRYFLDEGFAIFAPNSFARPGRKELCGTKGTMNFRIKLRREELKHTFSMVREIEWIDSSRLVLAGFSEGGQAASSWKGKEFIAHVLFGTDCRYVGRSPKAPGNVPVLNLVGSNDNYGYGRGCIISRKRPKGSRRVIVQGGNHAMTNSDIPKAAIGEFLRTCCKRK